MGDQHSEPAISIPECGTGPPLPVNEPQRLAALKRYDLLDTPPEQAFDSRRPRDADLARDAA
jgi:hypothetical protein